MDTNGYLTQRLEALEISNKRLRQQLSAMAVLLITGLVLSFSAQPGLPGDVITARQFVLVDAAGNECGAMTANDGQPRLSFKGPMGASVVLEAGPSPSLQLNGTAGGKWGRKFFATLGVGYLDLESQSGTGTIAKISLNAKDQEAGRVAITSSGELVWQVPDGSLANTPLQADRPAAGR